jgi:hypothetical protein
MLGDVTWQSVGAFCTFLAFLSAILWILIRFSLRGSFVDNAMYELLAGRVTTIEGRLDRMPTHQDMTRLGERLGDVEVGVAAASATLKGMETTLNKIDHRIDMLFQNELGAMSEPRSKP